MSTGVLYTARERFGPNGDGGLKLAWDKYVAWSRLHHLEEVVSLDVMLNGSVFEFDFESAVGVEHMVPVGEFFFGLYASLPYVLQHAPAGHTFNLLAVVGDPGNAKADLSAAFDFIGYDLLDRAGDISALVNCGGFDDSFSPGELNRWGLLDEYGRARQVQRDLLLDYPDEYHADCVLYEVWRHRRIGWHP